MKISIITVCFNSEETILDTLQSIANQSHKDVETIIVDGNSVDNTMEIISTFNSITTIISEPDKGIYDAMNKGVSLASGDIVGILNSDDIYHDSEVLRDIEKCFIEDSQLDILYGDLQYVKRNMLDTVVRSWRSRQYYNRFFEHANVPPHPTLFLRRNVYSTAGLFDTKYKLAADYEFMIRIFKKHNFKSRHIPRWMVKMRLGGATNKSLRNIFIGNKEIHLAWKDNDLHAPLTLMPLKFFKRLIQFI